MNRLVYYLAKKCSLRREDDAERERERIHDPPIITKKGRPRTARLTSRREGAPRGGGPKAGPKTRHSKRTPHARKPIPPKSRRISCSSGDDNDDDDTSTGSASLSPPAKKRAYRCRQCKVLRHGISHCPWNK